MFKVDRQRSICCRCFDEFEAISYHLNRATVISIDDYKIKYIGFHIPPIADRLNADEIYTGKGIPS